MLNHTTLGDLINWLGQQDPNLIVLDGFGSPHSDRGSYDELAFTPLPSARIGDMLKYAESAVGDTFTGWKGGEYTMDLGTPVYLGEYGDCGEAITPITFKYWALTAHKGKGKYE